MKSLSAAQDAGQTEFDGRLRHRQRNGVHARRAQMGDVRRRRGMRGRQRIERRADQRFQRCFI